MTIKLRCVLEQLPVDIRSNVRAKLGKWSEGVSLSAPKLEMLEKVIFEEQERLDYSRGKKRNVDILTLNDIRNVILDELEVNDPHPHLRWPNVERMKRKMTT